MLSEDQIQKLCNSATTLLELAVVEPVLAQFKHEEVAKQKIKLEVREKLLKQFNSNERFRFLVKNSERLPGGTKQLFALVELLICLEASRNDMQQLKLVQQVMENKILIDEECIEEFLALLVDVRGLIYRIDSQIDRDMAKKAYFTHPAFLIPAQYNRAFLDVLEHNYCALAVFVRDENTAFQEELTEQLYQSFYDDTKVFMAKLFFEIHPADKPDTKITFLRHVRESPSKTKPHLISDYKIKPVKITAWEKDGTHQVKLKIGPSTSNNSSNLSAEKYRNTPAAEDFEYLQKSPKPSSSSNSPMGGRNGPTLNLHHSPINKNKSVVKPKENLVNYSETPQFRIVSYEESPLQNPLVGYSETPKNIVLYDSSPESTLKTRKGKFAVPKSTNIEFEDIVPNRSETYEFLPDEEYGMPEPSNLSTTANASDWNSNRKDKTDFIDFGEPLRIPIKLGSSNFSAAEQFDIVKNRNLSPDKTFKQNIKLKKSDDEAMDPRWRYKYMKSYNSVALHLAQKPTGKAPWETVQNYKNIDLSRISFAK